MDIFSMYASGDEPFVLSSGEIALVQKFRLSFREWAGKPIENTYGGKAVIDFEGEPVFAELAVLRMFEAEGWQGVWVDSFGRKYRTGIHGNALPVHLPESKEIIIENLKVKTGASGGCWDVFAWRGDQIRFVELKRIDKDKIRSTQIAWLEAAIDEGFPLSCFTVVEWDLK